MAMKLLAGAVALALLLGFLVPIALKLQELALGVVMSIGVAMMLVDLAQSLRSKEY